VALVASARRQALLHAHRHRLRADDLEDCLSQATIELVSRARTGTPFSSTAHIANALEQRFLSRIHDRRRALGGRSPMQARLEHALVLDVLEDEGRAVPDPRAGTEELVELRLELRRLPEVARGLSADQRLVLACQVGLQMSPATFCATYGWSAEKYRKVAQRARARLRALSDCAQEGVPFAVEGSEEEKGIHL
jgi:DNA-directed RNA polymerase specialized sigma24 family protein